MIEWFQKIPRRVALTFISLVAAVVVNLVPDLAQYSEALNGIIAVLVFLALGDYVAEAARAATVGVKLQSASWRISPEVIVAAAAFIVAGLLAAVPALEPYHDMLVQVFVVILSALLGQVVLRAAVVYGRGLRNLK